MERTRIRIDGRLWGYPKLMAREETIHRLEGARDSKVMTPGLKIIDPKTRKVVIEATYEEQAGTGYRRKLTAQQTVAKITED